MTTEEACGGGLGQLPSEIVTLILSFAVPPADTPLEEVAAALRHRLVCRLWNDIVLAAHFADVTVREPEAASSAVVRLLKYKGGLYITLPTRKRNVSSYKLPSRERYTNMTDIVTRWFAIRFNPETFVVNTGDYTFAKSTGYNKHHAGEGPFTTTHVPFATCFGCEAPSKDDGTAVVDLRGTPFAVPNKFDFGGYIANGTWTYSHRAQVVQLTGGGYCGWTAPVEVAKNEHLACNGGWHLTLSLVR